MATAYGDYTGTGYGIRAIIEATVSNTSDSVATITYTARVQSNTSATTINYGQSRVRRRTGSGSWTTIRTDYPLQISGTGTVQCSTGTFTVTREYGSSQTVQVEHWYCSPNGSSDLQTGSTATVSVTVSARPYSAPAAPSNCTATRSSDTQVSVTWTNGTSTTGAPRSAVYVERSVDGGSFSQIASVGSSTASYTDNSTSANHYYQYRVRSYGSGGTSSYATSGYVYMTPAAPSSVTVTRDSGTVVTVNADVSNVVTATSYNVQYSVNSGDWSSSTSTTTFPISMDPGGGSVQVRVQSVRDTLTSDWTTSDSIMTTTAPYAPSVTVPTVTATGEEVTISWVPNHPDGSAQTQAQVEVTIGSSTDTYTVSGSTTTYSLGSYSEETTITVRVRTYGLYEDWGEWSSYYQTSVRYAPTTAFTFPPYDGFVIGSIPLEASWDVADATGITYQTLSLVQSGTAIWSTSVPVGTTEYSIGFEQYQLSNLTDYTLRLVVGGGTGLSTTTERSFSTSWVGPGEPLVETSVGDDLSVTIQVTDIGSSGESGESVTISREVGTLLPGLIIYGPESGSNSSVSIVLSDGETSTTTAISLGGSTLGSGSRIEIDATGSATLISSTGSTTALDSIQMPTIFSSPCTVSASGTYPMTVRVTYPEASSFAVSRVTSDGTWVVETGLEDGGSAHDPLPPLNTTFTYLVTAISETGATASTVHEAYVDSGTRAAYNFASGANVVFITQYDFDWSESLTHDGSLYYFAGQSLPTFYQTDSKDGTYTNSFHLVTEEAFLQLREITRAYAIGWLRTPGGQRMRGRFIFSLDRSAGSPVTNVSATMTEVVWQEAW